jgi:hypothetical protein
LGRIIVSNLDWLSQEAGIAGGSRDELTETLAMYREMQRTGQPGGDDRYVAWLEGRLADQAGESQDVAE